MRRVGGINENATGYNEVDCEHKAFHNRLIAGVAGSYLGVIRNFVGHDGPAMKTSRELHTQFPRLPNSEICIVDWDPTVHAVQYQTGLATCIEGSLERFIECHPWYIRDCNCAYIDGTSCVDGRGGWKPRDDWYSLLSMTTSPLFVLGITVTVRGSTSKPHNLTMDEYVRTRHIYPVISKLGWVIDYEKPPPHIYHRPGGQNMLFYLYCLRRM